MIVYVNYGPLSLKGTGKGRRGLLWTTRDVDYGHGLFNAPKMSQVWVYMAMFHVCLINTTIRSIDNYCHDATPKKKTLTVNLERMYAPAPTPTPITVRKLPEKISMLISHIEYKDTCTNIHSK